MKVKFEINQESLLSELLPVELKNVLLRYLPEVRYDDIVKQAQDISDKIIYELMVAGL